MSGPLFFLSLLLILSLAIFAASGPVWVWLPVALVGSLWGAWILSEGE